MPSPSPDPFNSYTSLSPFIQYPLDDADMDDPEQSETWPIFPLFDNELSAMPDQDYQTETSFSGASPGPSAFNFDNPQNGMNGLFSSPSVPASNPTSRLTDPMHRFVQTSNDPWFIGRSDSAPISTDTFQNIQYREPVPSDAASSIITGARPDSGYNTISDEPSVLNQDVPQLQAGMDGLHPTETPTRASSRRSAASSIKEGPLLCTWGDGCVNSYRLQSDLRKHLLRHEKPRRCATCGKGFANTNDRDRHQKNVHQGLRPGDKAWKCSFPNCRSSNKIWPRQDNFRAHVKQHSDVGPEVEKIIHDSEITVPSDSFQPHTSPASVSSASNDLSIHTSSPPALTADSTLSPRSPILRAPYSSSWTIDPNESSFNTPCETKPFVNAFRSSFSGPHSLPTSHPSSIPLVSTSATPSPLPHSRYLSASRSASTRSSSTNGDIYLGSKRPIRHARIEKPQVTEGSVIIHNHGGFTPDTVTDDPDLIAQVEEIIQTGRTKSELLQAVRHLRTTQKYRKLEQPSQTDGQLVPLSRGRHSPAPDGIIVERARSNDSRCTHRKAPSTDMAASSTNVILQPPDSNNLGGVKYPCPRDLCDKSFERRSTLEKHITRHDKPYACTFDSCTCSKAFGSKNDWKRHENSRHHQPELWRCEKCCQTFTKDESFSFHMQRTHGITENSDLVKLCNSSRIGANHAETFWCGFHRQIIKLSPNKKGVEAWDERYNHIAAHFVPDKEGKRVQFRIEDWLPPDGHLTKGEKEAALDIAEPLNQNNSTIVKNCAPYQLLITSPDDSSNQISRLDREKIEPPPRPLRKRSPKRKRTERYGIVCCQCSEVREKWTPNCLDCCHESCDQCERVKEPPLTEMLFGSS